MRKEMERDVLGDQKGERISHRDRGIRLRVEKTAEGRPGQAGQKC